MDKIARHKKTDAMVAHADFCREKNCLCQAVDDNLPVDIPELVYQCIAQALLHLLRARRQDDGLFPGMIGGNLGMTTGKRKAVTGIVQPIGVDIHIKIECIKSLA